MKHDVLPLLSISAMIALCAGVAIFGYLRIDNRVTEIIRTQTSLRTDITTLQSQLATSRTDLDAQNTALADRIYETTKRVDALTGSVEGFGSEVGQLSGSVKTLEKLTTTDPELLQKYSKIYFLNENYKPADLALIPEKFDLVNGKEVSVNTDMLPFLTDLLQDAQRAGIDIMVLSGYRSFAEQTTLKSAYSMRYGNGANQFSADQGYSEHQLGTTVDFTTITAGENLGQFEASDTFAWLQEHAYRYGFVLSYPDGNAFYTYEPWHWRFVGKELAAYLHKKNLHFYDLEQREIDGYVATLFDE